MIDVLHSRHGPHRGIIQIHLNTGFRSDLAWWQSFVQGCNGVSFLPTPPHMPVLEMASDASGTRGCGAWYRNLCFQIQWDSRAHEFPITVKELIPIVAAAATWGHEWSGHRVHCHCDNQAVVACLWSRTSKHMGLMHLLRTLVFVEAHFQFHLYPLYINTHANHLADDLSRNNLPNVFSKAPQAHPSPSWVSALLLDLLLGPQVDWISPSWRHQFNATFRKA